MSRYQIDSNSKLLLYDGRVYVPDNDSLKLDLLKEFHDSPLSGHPGRTRTHELLSRFYFWPKMRSFIYRYVSHCHSCIRAKPVRKEPFGYLKPLHVPDRPWSSISMDFVVGLPMSKGFNSICVIVDRFSKMAHFIPCLDTITASQLSSVFMRSIVRLHGFPNEIISDRGSVFTSKFWQQLLLQLRIKSSLSTAFHPQSDGQTERVNSILEQYLRIYVNYQQDDWYSLLPLAEFAYNNTQQSSTQLSPFYANYGYHPSIHFSPNPDSCSVPSYELTKKLNDLHDNIKFSIKDAQKSQEAYYNLHHRPTPTYEVGELVFVNAKNFSTNRPSKKLDHKHLGPFKISQKVGSHAYKLELPPSMRVHPVFHVCMLLPISSLPDIPHRISNPPPSVEIEGQEEFTVEQILDSRYYRGKVQYLVSWKGYPDPSDQTWEPYTNFDQNQDFHSKYPNKPRPKY